MTSACRSRIHCPGRASLPPCSTSWAPSRTGRTPRTWRCCIAAHSARGSIGCCTGCCTASSARATPGTTCARSCAARRVHAPATRARWCRWCMRCSQCRCCGSSSSAAREPRTRAYAPCYPSRRSRTDALTHRMDILLTHGYFLYEDPHELKVMKPYPTLGLLYISSHLKSRGFDVGLFDTTFSSKDAWRAYLQANRPSIVGIYTNLMTKLNVLPMIQDCKAVGATVV